MQPKWSMTALAMRNVGILAANEGLRLGKLKLREEYTQLQNYPFSLPDNNVLHVHLFHLYMNVTRLQIGEKYDVVGMFSLNFCKEDPRTPYAFLDAKHKAKATHSVGCSGVRIHPRVAKLWSQFDEPAPTGYYVGNPSVYTPGWEKPRVL